MHLVMILTAVAIAFGIRLFYYPHSSDWHHRWETTRFYLLFPPVLLLFTSVAVVCMGTGGEMLGVPATHSGYSIAVAILVWSGISLVWRLIGVYRCLRQLDQYPTEQVLDQSVKLLSTLFPYSAQIGWWHSYLVISEGLQQTLDPSHLEAVFAHEQAHVYYRDTFWGFWWGWLRSVTPWLPHTQTLWQELILLREMRADARAAQTVDSLTLAEALLTVAQAPNSEFAAAFSCILPQNRLIERIDALIELDSRSNNYQGSWQWLWLGVLPLLTLPLHY